MIDPVTGRDVASGFFLVRPARELYLEFQTKLELDIDIYGWPRKGRQFDAVGKSYHGTDRDPLGGAGDELAEQRVDELENDKKAYSDGLIFDLADVNSVRDYLSADGRYELIWAKEVTSADLTPAGFTSLGFEPTWFCSPFSALCDCMFLPRWHGADPDNLDLIGHYDKLNAKGLFDTSTDAEAFLAHYLTFEWAEQPGAYTPYVFIEVFAPTTTET
jgi:hypothetical protein